MSQTGQRPPPSGGAIFGGCLLMAVGGLMALLCGACTALFVGFGLFAPQGDASYTWTLDQQHPPSPARRLADLVRTGAVMIGWRRSARAGPGRSRTCRDEPLRSPAAAHRRDLLRRGDDGGRRADDCYAAPAPLTFMIAGFTTTLQNPGGRRRRDLRVHPRAVVGGLPTGRRRAPGLGRLAHGPSGQDRAAACARDVRLSCPRGHPASRSSSASSRP